MAGCQKDEVAPDVSPCMPIASQPVGIRIATNPSVTTNWGASLPLPGNWLILDVFFSLPIANLAGGLHVVSFSLVTSPPTSQEDMDAGEYLFPFIPTASLGRRFLYFNSLVENNWHLPMSYRIEPRGRRIGVSWYNVNAIEIGAFFVLQMARV